MSPLRVLPFLFVFGLPLSAAVAPGTRIDTLPAGKRTYTDVTVRSVNPVTVVITHSGGLASVPLRDLPADWRERFGHSPEAEAAAIAASTTRSAPAAPTPTQPADVAEENLFERLLASLGTAPALATEVDLRPQFFEMALHVKDQGRRPSCSVFAVVSALEFQNAELTGRPEKFSEEYLIWATRKVLGRIASADLALARDRRNDDDRDEGFSLSDVVTALRTYGVPRHDDMPNTLGLAMDAITEPDAALISEARRVRRVSVHALPGHQNPRVIAGLVHALNAGVPPVVGLKWPHSRAIRNGFLSRQQPVAGYSHAVTLVGYRCPTGRIEDTVFIFKNSWGVKWGQAGYGVVTHEYLNTNLQSAVVLEVRTAKAD